MTTAFDIADVPTVSGEELYQPMRWLIENGQGLALLKGLDEGDIRALEEDLWRRFDGTAEARLAVALRMRALLGVFGARRLKDLLLSRGFKVVRAAVACAAAERLNPRFGFSAQRFVMALEPATAPIAPATNVVVFARAA